VRARVPSAVHAAQRGADLRAGGEKHVGELYGLLHWRFDPVQVELGRGLLGVVDDVIQRGGERMAIAGVEWRAHAPAAADAMDDVVGDAVALPLAGSQVFGQRGVLGECGQELAQQQGGALYVASRVFDKGGQGRIDARAQPAHPGRVRILARAGDLLHEFFTTRSRDGNPRGPAAARPYAIVEASAENASTLYAGELEIRLGEGLVLATGRALTLSVREFELLAAMARRAGAIVTREELYSAVWGGELRPGDRSVDVYVSKLRGKLEAAMPDRRFIHTHPGFGYRFQPQPARGSVSGPSPSPGGGGVAATGGEPGASTKTDVSELSRDVHIGAPGT
jgi:DNA-binding winged helix-turn-helix (wHTH) protein